MRFLYVPLPLFAAPEGRRLGYHLKTGHTLSLQNRPTGLSQNKSSYTS